MNPNNIENNTDNNQRGKRIIVKIVNTIREGGSEVTVPQMIAEPVQESPSDAYVLTIVKKPTSVVKVDKGTNTSTGIYKGIPCSCRVCSSGGANVPPAKKGTSTGIYKGIPCSCRVCSSRGADVPPAKKGTSTGIYKRIPCSCGVCSSGGADASPAKRRKTVRFHISQTSSGFVVACADAHSAEDRIKLLYKLIPRLMQLNLFE